MSRTTAVVLILVGGLAGAVLMYVVQSRGLLPEWSAPSSDADPDPEPSDSEPAPEASEADPPAADDDDSAVEEEAAPTEEASEAEPTPAPARYRVSSKSRKSTVYTGEWVEIDITVKNPPSSSCSAKVRWKDKLGGSHHVTASPVSGSGQRFLARWKASTQMPFGSNPYRVTATCGGDTTTGGGSFKHY